MVDQFKCSLDHIRKYNLILVSKITSGGAENMADIGMLLKSSTEPTTVGNKGNISYYGERNTFFTCLADNIIESILE